jgi:hypothetical protein
MPIFLGLFALGGLVVILDSVNTASKNGKNVNIKVDVSKMSMEYSTTDASNDHFNEEYFREIAREEALRVYQTQCTNNTMR